MKVNIHCKVTSLKSNICSTDCVYHSTLTENDITILSSLSMLSIMNSFRDSSNFETSLRSNIISEIHMLTSMTAVGPFITNYHQEPSNEEFKAEKYFNFKLKDKHKGTNKVFINLNETTEEVEILNKPVLSFNESYFLKNVEEFENAYVPGESLISTQENNRTKIKLKKNEFIIIPVENYFYKIKNSSQLSVLHGYFIAKDK